MRHPTQLVSAFLGLLVVASAEAQDDSAIRNSVVKVMATMRFPNYLQPWQRQQSQQVAGSGVVIEGKRILTNAHIVTYTGQIYVQPFQSSDTFRAKITALSTAMDLAILELGEKDEDAFFADRQPIKLASDPPHVKDSVSVYGYPIGGTTQSVTKGTVSRIEFVSYNSGTSGLRVEVSAGLNVGNSGGPALVQDRIVGLVFGVLSRGQNLGYLIPAEEIDTFLKDIRDGRYDGKPQIWDVMHTLENTALRAKLGLSRSTKGVLVSHPTRAAKPPVLRKGDIITKIGKHQIDNTGMVTVNPQLRLSFMYFVPKVSKNDRIPLTLIRDGQTLTVEAPIFVGDDLSLLKTLKGQYPSYFVWGPLVFSAASSDFVGAVAPYISSNLGLRNSPLMTRGRDIVAFPGEELVVVTTMFPHTTSKGYDNPVGQVVASVNGKPVRNLRHLAETLRDAKAEFIEIEFADQGVATLVFDRQEVLDSLEDILADNSIRKQCSPDLDDVWKNVN